MNNITALILFWGIRHKYINLQSASAACYVTGMEIHVIRH